MSAARGFAVVLLAAASLAAQETFVVGDRQGAEQVEITYAPSTPPARPGGFGAARMTLCNTDGVAHEVLLEASDAFSDTRTFVASRTVRLGAGESAVAEIPVAWSPNGLRLDVRVDGRRAEGRRMLANSAYYGYGFVSSRPATLVVGDTGGFAQRLASELDLHWGGASRPGRGMTGDTESVGAAAGSEIGADWTALSRYDAIVVDARGRGLEAAGQRAVADWVAAGGTLVLVATGEADLPEGPLRAWCAELASSDEIGSTDHGAGRVVALAGGAVTAGRVDAALRPAGGALPGVGRRFSGPPVDGWFARLVVPDLGAIPVRLFLVLIVTYLGFVGVQARRILRQRRPARLLVFLPVAGFGFAAAILAYGVISEGLGAKGAVRSLTLLDQRARTATVFAARTLYAGLGADRLPLGPRTLIYAPELARQGSQATHRLALDLDRGRSVSGDLLPARTPTTLVTASVDTVRERLRFRRRDDGALDVLAEPSFRPVPGSKMVVRDHAGAWFAGAAPGPLTTVSDREAEEVLGVVLRTFDGPSVGTPYDDEDDRGSFIFGRRIGWGSYPPADEAPESDGRKAELAAKTRALATRVLRAGGYVASVEDVPYLDAFDLKTNWKASAHLVAARLAEDDFGR